ncbi:MAG TPA: zf-TFIIB domain-containing protein [Gemmatimonadales bacterium]|nr:zf-TFIIB domain-containing protein [Gemmatimonadales bacterium]
MTAKVGTQEDGPLGGRAFVPPESQRAYFEVASEPKMDCPACGEILVGRIIEDLTIDACERACGGIWFDARELERVDDPSDTLGEALLDIPYDSKCVVDLSRKRRCPHCNPQVMGRHFYSVKRRVVVDECPQCRGHWLDRGELAEIRSEYASEQERRPATQAVFDELFGEELRRMSEHSAEGLERARRVARTLRLICPSYYLPGKQGWGAF